MEERDLHQAFRTAFDVHRPRPDAPDRAFERVAAGASGAYGPGRRLAGASAVGLALLVVFTLLIVRGAAIAPPASSPAGRPSIAPATPPLPTPPPGVVNQPQPSLVAVLDEHVALAGWSRDGEVELTVDGGATWKPVSGQQGQLFDLQWVDGDTAVVSTGTGLYLFTRSASRWARLTPRNDLVHLDFTDRSAGFAVTAAGDVVETSDSGRTFAIRDVGLHPVTWLQWVSSTRAWAAGPKGITMTRDGGATWVSQLTLPVAPGGSVEHAQVGFRDEANGFAMFDYGPGGGSVVYHTADGGATWTAEGCTCDAVPTWLSLGAASMLPPGRHSDLVVTAPSSALLVVNDPRAGTASVCATTDAGREWSCSPAPFTTPPRTESGPAALAARGPSWFLVHDVTTTGPLLAVSHDTGATWTTGRP